MIQSMDEHAEYKVKLDQFEGPLDLLLYLIKKQELNIYNIPIARITQQYLDYINMLEFLNLELAGEFLVMAATLMRIKARMLLPSRDEEGEDEVDPRRELVQQLLEYQKFKQAAGQLETMEYQRGLLFTRPGPDGDQEAVETEYSYNLYDLLIAFKKVMEEAKERVFEVAVDEVSIEEKIGLLKQKLDENEMVAFRDLFDPKSTLRDLVTTFLALLEILRLGNATVRQSKPFSEIWIHRVVKERGDGGAQENS
jgi:segregation and condensation protein A